jgi:hypothetical protein
LIEQDEMRMVNQDDRHALFRESAVEMLLVKFDVFLDADAVLRWRMLSGLMQMLGR